MFLEVYRIQIRSSKIQTNCMGKPLFVSEPTSMDFDGFDALFMLSAGPLLAFRMIALMIPYR